MGEVYLARDTRLGRTVALKVLAPHLVTNQKAQERFEREARVIATLNHPNVCTVHDVGQVEGHMFLVLEHLQGETLAQRLHDLRFRPVRLADALSFGAQIADALHAAHAAGIVHRDLKPGNVMLTSTGVKLLDFGIARLRPTEAVADSSLPTSTVSELTEAGMILGTLSYMAPEQLDGRPVDARTDIFALGALLYELFTGRRAFDGRTSASIIGAILKDEPKPFALVESTGVPLAPILSRACAEALEPIVFRCLAKAPGDRWQSAKDIAYVLRAIPSGPAQHDPGAAAALPSPPPRRWSRVVATLAAVGLSGAAGLLVGQNDARSTPAKASVVRTRIDPGISAAYRTGTVPSLSHNGRMLALTTAGGISILDLTNGAVIPLSNAGQFRAWSPDDRRVIFTVGVGTFRVAEIAGGTVTLRGEVPLPPSTSGLGCFTWAGNDVVVGTRGPLIRTPMDTPPSWQPASTLDEANGETGHQCSQVLPDGRHMLFSVRQNGSAGAKVFVGELGGSTRTPLFTIDGSNFQFVPPRWLLYGVGTTLVAQEFDPGRRELRGERVTIASDVGRDPFGFLHFSASDAGLLVAQAAGSVTQLQWFDRSGAPGKVEVTGDFASLTLSGDRRFAALHRRGADGNSDVWTYEFDRGVLSRISTSPLEDSFPLWTHDRASMVFSRMTATGSQIIETAADGSRERVLFDSPTKFLVDDIDRDGNIVVENLGVRGGPDLFVLRRGATSVETMVQTPFREEDGQLSPDGGWLAYGSDQSGRTEVYVQPFGHPGPRLQVSTAGGETPRWRRDGRELYFVGPEGTITATQVTTSGSTLGLSTPTPLFKVDVLGSGGQQYEVSPDGQRFLVNVVKASALNLIVNWPGLLAAQ